MHKISLKALFLAIAVACIGITGSVYLATQVKNQLQTESHLKLTSVAEQISEQIQDSVDIAINDLRALQAFYASSTEVTHLEFREFTHSLLGNGGDHIQALEWIPKVSKKNRKNFESTIQRSFAEFSIREKNEKNQMVSSAEKNYYYPVTYVEPYAENQAAHGFDLNSSATRRISLEFSRDSGEFAATAPIRLVQEEGESSGFLIFAPVYPPNSDLRDAGDRSRAIQGFVLGVFRVDSLLKKASERAEQEGLTISVSDLGAPNGELLFGSSMPNPQFRLKTSIQNRQWELQITTNSLLQASSESPVISQWILAGGSFSSILLAFFCYALQIVMLDSRNINTLKRQLQSHNETLEETVAERTEALKQQNQVLNQNVVELTDQRKILSSLMEDAQAAKDDSEQRATELAKSNRDLDDFAYIASHDLKAPLRGIDQLANWLKEDIEAGEMDDVNDHLLLMRQRIQRLEKLLNDLLAYSRVNKQENRLTTVDCKEMIDDLFFMASPPAGFRLTVHKPMPSFTTVGTPFEQIFRNLLGNAIKHNPLGNGHIQVRCHEHDEYYKFSVEDDGPGIASDYHELIFKMFKTLKPRDETEGSGMGLTLIKRIVEHYKGSVYLESAEGQGCIFYFTWPKAIQE